MAIKKYELKNLDCANCAARIETSVQEMEGVNFASVNFATSTLHIDVEDIARVTDRIQQVEPEVEVVSDAQNETELETQDWRELIQIGLAFVILALGLLYQEWLAEVINEFAVLIVFGAAYLISGWPVIARAYKNVRQGNWFDETFLMSISTIGAMLIREYPEAVVVMLFYQIGEYVQGLSVNRSRRSIRALMDVRPDQANLLVDGNVQTISPEKVAVGETILVRPGEKVPLDGIVLEGHSQLDTSTLTGESVPVEVFPSAEVLAGTVNQTGLLKVQVSRPFDQSSVSKLLEVVQNAANRKARTERFITRFARVYSPVMVSIALLVAFVPPLVVPEATFREWIYRALVVLVVSCPCALVISIPLGYFGGIGGASRRGILVKGANFLDVLADVKTVVFDKTGTLTRGTFKVTEIATYNGWTEDELLSRAAQAEASSTHPVAHSIRQAYGPDRSLKVPESFEEIPGMGIRARMNGSLILVGNDGLMHANGIEHLTCDVPGTVVHVAMDGDYAGYLVVSDEVKPAARDTIEQLHHLGIERTVMLSGDRKDVAAKVADQLGLDGYYAELLPEDKVEVMEAIMAEGREGRLAFVGDGINDAPALSRADVGLAMGALGSDAAIETADVVLMTDSPLKVAEAIRHARRTRRIVWQNILLALGVKALFIGLGVFGVASMWEAVFADVGVTILAVLNATRVLK